MTLSRARCHDVPVTAPHASPMTGFSHVQLRVTDVPASERWYTTVLGLERFSGDDSVGYVALRHKPSGVVIVLSTRESAHRVDTALDHLAFAVPDGTVLAEWALHLSDAGIDHDGVVFELGKPSLQLRDPDGNAIELVAPAPR
jgi:glyoxylase I family protein